MPCNVMALTQGDSSGVHGACSDVQRHAKHAWRVQWCAVVCSGVQRRAWSMQWHVVTSVSIQGLFM